MTFICPFPAGGGTDILVRLLAAELQDKLKRPVIVDNRVGAGTLIAASAVAKSPPDGYTLFLAPVTTLAIGPAIYKKLPYDTVKDFAPVGLVGSAQFALVANPNIGAPTLPDLIALVKSKNGQMSYGTSGASTPHHLLMEMFLQQIGAKAQHVPYRGSVPAMTDVISGQIPFMMVDLAVAMGAIRGGQAQGLRRHLAEPHQGDAGSADHRGSRSAGLTAQRLVLGGGGAPARRGRSSTSSTAY